MKIISRLFAMLMVLCLCCGAAASAATELSLTKTAMLNVIPKTADEWYSDDFNRALVATLTLFDIVIAEADQEFIDIMAASMKNDTVFVGRDQDTILVFFLGNDGQAIIAYYVPEYDAFTAQTVQMAAGKTAEAQMNTIRDAGIVSSYYAVPYEMMNAIYASILNAAE